MKKKTNPIKLNPYIADYIWGGLLLSQNWGKSSPNSNGKIAETWEVSLFPGKESVVDGGKFDGANLAYLYKNYPRIFGKRMSSFAQFPLLVKIINSDQRLSVQVHPNDDYALSKEGQLGKTEIWYIAEAKPSACVYYGFNKNTDKVEVRKKIEDGSIEEILNKVSVKKGDLVSVNPGTVHALLEGVVVIEIQENSNLTYRLYDYNRVDDCGQKRELHIEKALEIVNFEKTDVNIDPIKDISNDIGEKLIILKKTKYFNAYVKTLKESVRLFSNESFIAITAISGRSQFSTGEIFEKGSTFFIPANQEVTLSSIDKEDEFMFVAVTLGHSD